jgi:hypothetical protein
MVPEGSGPTANAETPAGQLRWEPGWSTGSGLSTPKILAALDVQTVGMRKAGPVRITAAPVTVKMTLVAPSLEVHSPSTTIPRVF